MTGKHAIRARTNIDSCGKNGKYLLWYELKDGKSKLIRYKEIKKANGDLRSASKSMFFLN